MSTSQNSRVSGWQDHTSPLRALTGLKELFLYTALLSERTVTRKAQVWLHLGTVLKSTLFIHREKTTSTRVTAGKLHVLDSRLVHSWPQYILNWGQMSSPAWEAYYNTWQVPNAEVLKPWLHQSERPVTQLLKRLRQECYKFEVSMGFTARSCLNE